MPLAGAHGPREGMEEDYVLDDLLESLEQPKSSMAALPATTCEAPFQKLNTADHGLAPPWSTWSQVPKDPYLVRDLGSWCLELFAGGGVGVFTAHLRQRVNEVSYCCR